MSVTWFNVTESFPDLQSPRAGKAQADEGSIWLHILPLFWVGFFVLYLTNKQCEGESLKKHIRIWSGEAEEGARTRSIFPPAK